MSKKLQNEDALIRRAMTAAIKRSGLSRDEVAARMTESLKIRVTKRMIDGYSGVSNRNYRLPPAFEIAFCKAVSDWTLLADRVSRAGFRMIGPDDERLIQIGKAYLQKCEAEAVLRKVEL